MPRGHGRVISALSLHGCMMGKTQEKRPRDMLVKEDQTRRLQDPLSVSDTDESTPNKDIQFGYHSAAGRSIQIINNGLGAERMYPDFYLLNGVAYGAQPLKGQAEFEVKMVSYYGAKWCGSIQVGLRRCKKGVPIESGPGIPEDSRYTRYHLVWSDQRIDNNLFTPGEWSNYGYVDLRDLCEGDYIGLRLSQGGVLEFTVNDESQGIAAKNIYTRDTESDVYAVVDHCGSCIATVITKAVIDYGAVNLQELCLERLSSWLKSGDEVDRLPLPTRLKDKLKWYFGDS